MEAKGIQASGFPPHQSDRVKHVCEILPICNVIMAAGCQSLEADSLDSIPRP